jgi:uncharacterized phage-associated protein
MVRAIDAANFFIDYFRNSDNNDLTNLKLQKLIYYSQGLHLAKTGEPLFNDDIKAWDDGPVVQEIYWNVKDIYEPKVPVEKMLCHYDNDKFDEDEYNSLLDTILNFGKYGAWDLANMSHESGGPWDIAHKQGRNTIIEKTRIKEYFKNKKYPHIEDIFSKLPVVEGFIHENGNLVFPV